MEEADEDADANADAEARSKNLEEMNVDNQNKVVEKPITEEGNSDIVAAAAETPG